MTLMQRDRENYQEGKQEEKLRISMLIKALLDDGRADDLKRASEDAVFMEALLKEYGIHDGNADE